MLTYPAIDFPGAFPYRAFAKETPPDYAFPWSERHLRCVWADPAYRPAPLTAADGRIVTVVEPGYWNLEAGPDFLDAVLRVGPGECTIRGDIEIHIRPADWRHHGHAGDPRYRRVVAHVTYHDGTLPESDLPASVLQIALRTPLKSIPSFSFEGLDPSAYPFAVLSPSPPCARVLQTWSPERREGLLDSAGAERIRLKTGRIAQSVAETSASQTLYEELMAGLGYKYNRAPFRKLARLVSLDCLRRETNGDSVSVYAVLAGVAGLLPAQNNPLWDAESRAFVRSLWDIWWKCRARWDDVALQREEWTLSSLRPVNHPLRRLMAAAVLFTSTPPLEERVLANSLSSPEFCRNTSDILTRTGLDTFWSRREGLSGHRHPEPIALIGQGRAAALLTNVIIPWASAITRTSPGPEVLAVLPGEDDNLHTRHTAHALFGRDHNPALYRRGLRQQGLLQIFHDFCLNSRNGCSECAFPTALSHQNL